MAYREIEDEDGVWMVFSTEPRSGANVRPQYAQGWLSFQRGAERRRLAPIPMDWEHADDGQIRQWLHSAEPVEKTTDDDWMAGDLFAEPRAGKPERDTLAPAPAAEAKVDAPRPPAESGPLAKAASGPASLVHQSIERIRAMLSDIRSHDK